MSADGMSALRLFADVDLCMASGQCSSVAPEFFTHDDDGVVVLRRTEIPDGDDQAAQHAVRLCPVQAIRVAPVEEGTDV